MKVLIVVESFPATSETFVLNHIKGLLDAGVEVRIFTFNSKQDVANPVYEKYGLRHKTLVKQKLSGSFIKRYSLGLILFVKCFRVYPKQTLSSLNVWQHGKAAIKLIPLYELALFATRERFDIVHCHFGTMGEKVAGYQLQGLLLAPLVVSFHGYDVDSPFIVNNPTYYAHLKQRSDAYLVNSGYTLRRIASLGFDTGKATVIPASFDVKLFKRSEPKAKNSGVIRLITVGRLIPVKGIDFALQALSVLRGLIGNTFEYLIIGEGPEESKLKSLTAQLCLNDRVKFLGKQPQEEVRKHLESSDIFLLTGVKDPTGREEGQGLVVQEAQAMELPVVVSNIGGTSEGLMDGETGFLVEEKNINQLVKAIGNLIGDPQLRNKMGRAGRKFVEGKYSIEETTSKILAAYHRQLWRAS